VGCDGEIARVLQSLGLAPQLREVLRPSRGMSFLNEEGDLLLDWSMSPDRVGDQGWADQYTYHQPAVEQLLRDRIAASEHVQLRTGQRVTRVTELADHVELEVQDVAAGSSRTLAADWVVGCDGAGSIVRPTMGSAYQNLGPDQPWLVVDVVIDEGVQTPEKSVQYCWPSRPHMYLRLPGARRRWEFMVMPGDDEARLTEEQQIWSLLEPYVQQGQARLERAAVYRFRSMIASTWRSGRLMLAGDAAHLQPPMLAQGLCSGIRDAANLAWKLAAVVTGAAPDTLLDTYEAEREPHVRAWVLEATRIAAIVQVTDRELARRRDEVMLSGERVISSIRPGLGASALVSPDTTSGVLSRQLVTDDGGRSDDHLGQDFGLFVTDSLLAQLAPDVRARIDDLGDALTVVTGPAADRYLSGTSGSFALIRPDRYLLGLGSTGDELAAAVARVPLATTIGLGAGA